MKRVLSRCIAIATFFSSLSIATPHAYAESTLPSLEIMAGQMVMSGFRGTGENSEEEGYVYILEEIRTGRVGGIIFFDWDHLTKTPKRNIVSVEQTRKMVTALQSAATIPLFIGVDQEGGKVRRFKEEHGVAATPSPANMGNGTPENTRKEAVALGEALCNAGINLVFAPSLDVNRNPTSPAIGALGRSFSADAEKVAQHAQAFAAGLAQTGMVATYKHFPGHGSATEDTHEGMANITHTWGEAELFPYKKLLPTTPPAMVMMGHVVHKEMDAQFPASLSYNIVTDILRDTLDWQGVVITDDMQMQAITSYYGEKEAIRLAVLAGVDILLFGNNLSATAKDQKNTYALLLELVHEGAIPRARIEESYRRVMKLKAHLPPVAIQTAIENVCI